MSSSRVCCSSKKCARVRRTRQKPVSLPTPHATTTTLAFRQAENLWSSNLAVACVEFVSRQHLPRLTDRQVGTLATNTTQTRRVWRRVFRRARDGCLHAHRRTNAMWCCWRMGSCLSVLTCDVSRVRAVVRVASVLTSVQVQTIGCQLIQRRCPSCRIGTQVRRFRKAQARVVGDRYRGHRARMRRGGACLEGCGRVWRGARLVWRRVVRVWSTFSTFSVLGWVL